MTPESFPRRGQDSEEPEGNRPLPSGGNERGDAGRLSEDGRWVPDADSASGPEQGLFVCLPAEELTLAGFAQNGRADTMAPGPLLATVLEAITGEDGSGLAALSDDQLMGVLSGIRRIEARAAWGQLAVLAEFARRRPAAGEPMDTGRFGFSDFAPDEVAAELRVSVQSAAGQMMYAVAVAGRLPCSFAALAAGKIHAVHLRIIDDETRILSPELAAQADEILAGKAQSTTYGELRYAAHRLVLKLDADAARRRKETAAKRDAEVRRFRESSGNAGMIARELPCDEVLASWQHVDQRAHDLRAAGMPGSLRELRIRAYLDLLQERDSRLVLAGQGTGEMGRQPGPGGGDPADGNPGPAGPPAEDGGGGPGGNGGPGSGPAGRRGWGRPGRSCSPGQAGPGPERGRDDQHHSAAGHHARPVCHTWGGGRVRDAGRRRRPRPGGRRGPAPGHPVVRDRPAPRRDGGRARLCPRPPPSTAQSRPRRRPAGPGPTTRQLPAQWYGRHSRPRPATQGRDRRQPAWPRTRRPEPWHRITLAWDKGGMTCECDLAPHSASDNHTGCQGSKGPGVVTPRRLATPGRLLYTARAISRSQAQGRRSRRTRRCGRIR
ncbi:MAG: DUF222 domain-containing protein [Streptosporangiaceae bacterium]